MKERQILFNCDMVRAILKGRKTQTRRVVKLPKQRGEWEGTTIGGHGWFKLGKRGEKIPVSEMYGIWNTTTGHTIVSPYQIGDQLWVRETWAVSPDGDGSKNNSNCLFNADDEIVGLKKIPSIHMPRWASRIQLEITNIRVERLQDISDDDVIAEGINISDDEKNMPLMPQCKFFDLWAEINGQESVEQNPFVWVIEFRRIK